MGLPHSLHSVRVTKRLGPLFEIDQDHQDRLRRKEIAQGPGTGILECEMSNLHSRSSGGGGRALNLSNARLGFERDTGVREGRSRTDRTARARTGARARRAGDESCGEHFRFRPMREECWWVLLLWLELGPRIADLARKSKQSAKCVSRI